MGLRFFRRIRIAPGINLNLTKKGVSVSTGPRGSKYTVGTRGTRKTLSLPGTGLFYTLSSKRDNKYKSRLDSSQINKNKLDIGFLTRIVTPEREKNFIDGCKELIKGNEADALNYFSKVDHPDCMFLCGVIKFKQIQYNESLRYFTSTKDKNKKLGELFNKYEFYPSIELKITPEIICILTTDIRSLYLFMVESYQELNQLEEALKLLNGLLEIYLDDPIIKLSLSEILLEYDQEDKYKSLVKLTEDIENDSEIDTCLLYYKSIALYKLGLKTVANKILTGALRKKKGRSEELLNAIRYQRAIIYNELGQQGRSKKDLEIIYSTDPNYEDVPKRLGL